MKKVLLALFVALVLFVAAGGLEKFTSKSDTVESGVVQEDTNTNALQIKNEG